MWTGDTLTSWDTMNITGPGLLSLSLTGMSWCGSDIGGFVGDPDDEMHIRWY